MRKLATAAAVSLVLASSGAQALGLGDIEMRSALNQPMEAEIRLTSVQPGETDGMIVQLASPAAFARAGIERSPVLTGLQFSVEPGTGGPVIRISSRQPVLEPFLNFLLEVDWPQGRMVREYTVLLDPPVFMTPNATARNSTSDTPAQTQSNDNALIAPAPVERDRATRSSNDDAAGGPDASPGTDAALTADTDGEVVSLDSLTPADSTGQAAAADGGQSKPAALADNSPAAPAGRTLPDVELLGGNEEVDDEFSTGDSLAIRPSANRGADAAAGKSEVVSLERVDEPVVTDITVNRGDTLYRIADRARGSGVSVQQMMLALLAANQNAFINGNINLVKAGSILRVPNADDQQNLSQATALAEIGKQNDLWREYRDNLRRSSAARLAQTDTAGQGAPDADTSDAAQATETASDSAALSSDAQAILDDARNEVRNRRDLSIVADNTSTAGAASATADESQAEDGGRLGQINQQLQIAREELSSTRLQSQDLSDQSTELQNTTDNLDALMSLRQNEVAELEAQLTAAREAQEAREAREAEEAAAAKAAAAEQKATAEAKAAREAAAEAKALAASETEANASANGDAADDTAVADADAQATSGEQSVATASESGQGDNEYEVRDRSANALTTAGKGGSEVEPGVEGDAQSAGQSNARSNALDDSQNDSQNNDQSAAAEEQAVASDNPDNETNAADEPAVGTSQAGAWYQDLLRDPNKLVIAGIGGVGLLGLLGLLLRRRRKSADDDASFPDEVQYIDDDEADSLQRGIDEAGVTTADPVQVPVAAAVEPEQEQPVVTAGAASGQADDILSEADVYFAYGLHGQAEELLKSAVASNPENPDYARKLLQTYHAQGKTDAFGSQAQAFHARFGGASNPAWASIAALGHELDPGNTLYARDGDELSSVGMGGHANVELDATAFDLPDNDTAGSVNRHFNDEDTTDISEDDLYSSSAEGRAESDADLNTAAAAAASTYVPPAEDDFDSELDADLLDQSLDPALAFDESDLEATGDFSSLADELAAENEGSIDFSDFDAPLGDAAEKRDLPADADVVANSANAVGISGLDTHQNESGNTDAAAIENELTFEELSLADIDSQEADTDLDGLDLSSPVSDELAFDLERLSDDIDAGGNGLANGAVGELELAELNDEPGDLLSSGAAHGGDDADDMDTMMDLARAYIDMGDKDSASNTLDEIVKSGSPAQVSEAETLLRNIS